MFENSQKKNFTQKIKKEDLYSEDDYSLKACFIKLQVLSEKYPEIKRAKEISNHVCIIKTDSNTEMRKKHFIELEKMLSIKIKSDRERLESVMSKEEREWTQHMRIKESISKL